MVLDPIPQPLPVHFFGSRPQPPTSPSDSLMIFASPKQWIDLNPAFLYIAVLGTCSKIAQKNKMLALAACFAQPCEITFGLLLTHSLVSTKMKPMECFVFWVPLRIHVRWRNTPLSTHICRFSHSVGAHAFCDKLHHTATHCITLQRTAPHCTTCCTTPAAQHHNTLQHTATHCTTLHHTATHCITLQHTALHCNTLHHTATPVASHTQWGHMHFATNCITLQHTALHCNTLHHTAPPVASHTQWGRIHFAPP